jgi:salicylate hydroxylase
VAHEKLHVTIIGAGLGGLCLAQGLQKQGIAFDVYEKDAAADSRIQGYRIRIDDTGQRALATCLPPALNRLFRETCAVAKSHGRFLDPQLRPIEGRAAETWRLAAAATSSAADGAHAAGDCSANRLTLREILLCGIEDRVHFGKTFSRFRAHEGGGVGVSFKDGTIIDTDVLVAADGVNSTVRRQRLPHAEPLDTYSACIYGKTLQSSDHCIAAELLSGTSVIFADGFTVILDAMSFQFPKTEARLTPVNDYLYWAFIGRRRRLGIGPHDLMNTGDALSVTVQNLTATWHPALRAVFAGSAKSTTTVLPIRSAARLAYWEPDRVTVLGDAIHAMSPAGGLGANTALHDAARLADRLAAVVTGRCSLTDAIAAYEDEMRLRANTAIEASAEGAKRLFAETTVPALSL